MVYSACLLLKIGLILSSCPFNAKKQLSENDTPGDKKREPSETKFSIKNAERKNPFFIQHISIHILVMGGPPFFLADLSQPHGHEGQQLLHFALT
jgi:hypothetical protein